LSAITGTGRNGRITKADLAAASRPARSAHHVETEHGRIFFREWPAQGVARGTALLIHGLFAESQSFMTLGRKLAAKGLRALALDLPGHGETVSQATTVEAIAAAVVASLPYSGLHIVAHSFGAIVASRLLERAGSLTLLSPAGCGQDISGEFLQAMLGGHVDQAVQFLGETIPTDVKSRIASHLSVHAGQLRAITSAVAVEGSQSVSILSTLKSAKVPVQAIFMRDDAVIPAAHALNMPVNVAVHMMPGGSHLPHWRDPDVVLTLVETALARQAIR
jgi:pyruvate dehydrogenase E2 component (dihydrolipoamide acetyltransferase)